MKKSIKITSLCLIGCLYTTVGLADDKKAIWGTDGQAITKKPTTPVQTIKPKTEAQINPKQNINSWGSGTSGWKIAPQINPKPQTNVMSGMDGISGKKPQIKPQTVKDAKLDPIDK